VQSFDPAVQRAINRVQSFEETAAATESLRAVGLHGVNFDLIYGLPNESVASCLQTVRQCVELRPDRFSVFGYAHVPTFKKHQRKIDEARLPGGVDRNDQANAIAQALIDAGYVQIGMDHFVLPTDSMAEAQRQGTLHRNFQGYTTDRSDTLIGLGSSAIGRLAQGYIQNHPAIRAYAERIQSGDFATCKGYALTADDHLRAEIIERLMCDFEVDLQDICLKHHVAPEAVLQSATRLQSLEADGIIRMEGSNVRIKDDTRYLVRSVASAFDSHLTPAARLHSRAV
jgi:oxygen-independent coproporphyrinogen-3 oxidase